MVKDLESLEEDDIRWLNEITIHSEGLVGKKAAFLGEIYGKFVSRNVSIPEGFVLTKKAVSDFFSKTRLANSISNIFHELNWENYEELDRASKKVRELIVHSEIPSEIEEQIFESYFTLGSTKMEIQNGLAKDILSNAEEPIFVAIRGSHSSQEGDSYFNIKGKKDILNSIKRCIASYFEVNILKEENKNGISPDAIRPAVIIQKMIQSDKSGIVFSKDEIVINAIWGLGGGLKIGEIGRDEYILRRDFRILEKNVKEKKFAVTRNSDGTLKLVQLKEGYSFSQVLEEFEMQELADTVLRIDDVFGKPMKYEFACLDGGIYVVKIEELTLEEKTKEKKSEEKIIEQTEKIEEKEEIKIEIENKKIFPVAKITQTKIDLLIRNGRDKEEGNLTGIKRGFIVLEDIIKERGLHPNYYLENFNTKGYGELISHGIEILSEGLDEIYIRLSDFTSKEFKDLNGAPTKTEENPLMGSCGIRYLISKPELLKRELKAISDLAQQKSVCVLIPKISSVYELKKVKDILDGLNSKIKIGIVLETPASIQLIKDFIDEEINIVAFSGNSLSKYLLAIDPNNEMVKEFYDDTSPALMYQLEYVIRVCKRRGVNTKFFGTALKKKEMVDYLVSKGIDSVVLTAAEVNETSLLIERAEKEYISGTDKEARNYELNKEKERQKRELENFEKIKDLQVKNDLKKISQKEKVILENKDEPINEDLNELKENEIENFEDKQEILDDFIEEDELVEEEIFEINKGELREEDDLFDEEIEKFDNFN